MDPQHRINQPLDSFSAERGPFYTRSRQVKLGFTYIEMIVVMLILLLMSSLIMPNIVAHLRSASEKELEAQVARFPMDARNEAATLQSPVSIRISGSTLIMEEQVYDDTTQTSATGSAETTLNNENPNAGASGSSNNGAATTQVQLKTLDLGTTMQVASVQLNGQAADPGSWLWIVYPDGSAEQGGIEFTEGSSQKSLVLNSRGDSQWMSGSLPDLSATQWPAGQLATASSPMSASTP